LAREASLESENTVAADAGITRELDSLHQELSASQQARSSPADAQPAGVATSNQTSQLEDGVDEQLHTALGKFADAIREFVEKAEQDVSAHPAANVIGGIIVGILIGRRLGRR